MGDKIDVQLGKRLRNRRLMMGLTQAELAKACAVTFQQIQKYECGGSRISAGRLWQLAKALDVPYTYFFEGLDGLERGARPPTRKRVA